MNFTNKTDTVRRTVLKKIKNGNIRHRLENKKTSILFSFNPNTKIGVLSAEITPTIREMDYAVYGDPPALPINETEIIHALQQVLKTYNTPDVAVNDRLIVYVTNAYLKTIDQPYSFIDSKRIRRIVETYLKNTVSSGTAKTNENALLLEYGKDIRWLKSMLQKSNVSVPLRTDESSVKEIIESFERKIQEVANQIPHVRTEINTKFREVEDEAKGVKDLHTNVQQQIEAFTDKQQQIDTKVNDLVKDLHTNVQPQIGAFDTKVNDLVKDIQTNVQPQIEAFTDKQQQIDTKVNDLQTNVQQQIQEVATKLVVGQQNLRAEIYAKGQQQIEEILKQYPVMDEEKVKFIVEKLQTDLHETIQKQINELTKQILSRDAAFMEACIENYWGKLLIDTDDMSKNMETIIERVVKRYVEKDHSVADSCEDHTLHYDEMYGNPENEFGIENKNPIIDHIMNGNKKPQPILEEEDIYMDDVYQKHSETFNIVHHVNELRSSTDKKWVPFGKGVGNTVMDMYVDPETKKIYITGLFEQVDNVAANNIASYDITKKKWEHVGNGINNLGVCLAMDLENQILYIGGIFNSVDQEPNALEANNIVSYNLFKNEWETLGEGFNAECACLCFDNEHKILYAGGAFTKIGDENISYVAFYDRVQNKWFPLSDEMLNGPCRTMCMDTESRELFLGGVFTEIGEYMYYYVASFDTRSKEWTELCGGLQGNCNCLCLNSDAKLLYVGGTFDSVGSEENRIESRHIASYHLENHEWSPLAQGLDGVCHTMIYNAEQKCLIIGGAFTHVVGSNVVVNHIVKYDTVGNTWLPFDNFFDVNNAQNKDNIGLDGNCNSLCMDENAYYMCGTFKKAGTVHANSIVKYLHHRVKPLIT